MLHWSVEGCLHGHIMAILGGKICVQCCGHARERRAHNARRCATNTSATLCNSAATDYSWSLSCATLADFWFLFPRFFFTQSVMQLIHDVFLVKMIFVCVRMTSASRYFWMRICLVCVLFVYGVWCVYLCTRTCIARQCVCLVVNYLVWTSYGFAAKIHVLNQHIHKLFVFRYLCVYIYVMGILWLVCVWYMCALLHV